MAELRKKLIDKLDKIPVLTSTCGSLIITSW